MICPGGEDLYSEALCLWEEVTHVERYDCLRISVDCGLENKFVVGIAKLRSPGVVDLNQFCVPGQSIQEHLNVFVAEAVDAHLFAATEDFFVLEKTGGCGKRNKSLLRQPLQELSTRAISAAECSDDYGRIEDEAVKSSTHP